MSMPIKLDKWIRLNESVQRQVKNDEIQQIISQNLQLCRQRKSEDLKNLLKLLSDNLKVLIKVKLKNEEDIKKVLQVLLELASISLDSSQLSAYQILVKTFMQFIKLNKSLIDESDDILSQPINMICQDVMIITNRQSNEQPILKIQYIILNEMWKLFPDNFHGTHHLLKMIVFNRKCMKQESELNKILKLFEDVLWSCLPLPQFYKTFFTNKFNDNEELKIFYEICIEVMDRISSSAILLSTSSQSALDVNFCVQLIKNLSKSPLLMQNSPETFDSLIQRIVKLMISKELPIKNFQFIEKFIFQGIFETKQELSMNWICFIIFYNFISKLKSRKLLKNYFEILTTIQGQSSLIRSEFATRLLKLITNLNPSFENNRNDTQNEFINDYQRFIKSPSVQTYDKLLKSLNYLKSTRITSNDKEIIEAIGELIEKIHKCDWNTFTKLINAILDVIIETRESQTKIRFLLKFNPILNSSTGMSMKIRLKIVEMLFSFIHFSTKHEGVNGVLMKEFRKLFDEKNEVILMYIKSEVENNDKYKEFMTKLNRNTNGNVKDQREVFANLNKNFYRHSTKYSEKFDEFHNFIRTIKATEISPTDQIKINEICKILQKLNKS